MGQGGEAAGGGDVEVEGGARGRASRHADEHQQPGNDVLAARAMGQGGEAAGGGDGEE